MIGEFVIVRTFSAGVHMGTLVQFNETCVVLKDARRLWRWKGANSLNEVSLHGVQEGSRISEMVERICLTQAIEIIPCTEKAKRNLEISRWDA